jgi:hypothetical protein
VSGPFPWGWLSYLWCKHVHRVGNVKALTDGHVYTCLVCPKQHYFRTKEPPHAD